MNIYETGRLVSEYLVFHFGEAEDVLPWPQGPREALGFPARIVGRFSDGAVARALDLGCAVGRSSFELSRAARAVVGVDYSAAFIAAANRLKEAGRIAADRLEEGNRKDRVTLHLPDGVHPDRVRFEVGDAMNLRGDLGEFDRVLAANLLCRLSEPQRLLARLPSLVRPDGELILATPCTWLEDFTPPGNWPAGTTLDWLREKLGSSFDLVEQRDEPFLIRETARKFQWTVALLTKWRRRQPSGSPP